MAAPLKAVTATFTVSFQAPDSDGILIAEVDDRSPDEGGLNEDTNFKPGEKVYYLVYKGPGVTVEGHIHSWGSHAPGGSAQTVDKEENLTFISPDQLEQSLKYPVSGQPEWAWVGTPYPGGPPSFKGNQVTVKKIKGTKEKPGFGVGILNVKYKAMADPFILSHSPLAYEEYEIVTLVHGTYKAPTNG